MSNANVSGSKESVKERLGKLASPFPDAAKDKSNTNEVSAAPLPTVKADDEKTARRALIRKWLTRSALTILLLLIAGIGTVSAVYLRNPTIRRMISEIWVHHKDIIKNGHIDLTGSYNLDNYFPSNNRKPLTVLLLGVDHDYGGKRDYGHVAVPTGPIANMPGRSDAIMVARFEFDGDAVRSLNVLSIPRDTRVRIPGHGIHKINAAYAYGGPQLTMATIQDVFGIAPDYYADVNFEGFQQVVDAIGGVDVTIHQPLNYDDNWGNLHVHLKPGRQHLNGYKAMGYVRIRKVDDDLARAQRQHEFLEALRAQIVSYRSFMKLPDVVGAITNNLHSNLSENQLLTLANLARKAPRDAICVDTLPVTEGKVFVYIDKRKSENLIQKMFFPGKQLADLNINLPDGDTGAPRHHKRHSKDGGATTVKHRPSLDETAPKSDPAQDTSEATPDTSSSESEPAVEKPTPSGNPSSPDRPSPPPTPKSDNTTGSDEGKKSKEGSGTTSGSTSTILRG